MTSMAKIRESPLRTRRSPPRAESGGTEGTMKRTVKAGHIKVHYPDGTVMKRPRNTP